jgi:hypothetical protein
MSPMLTLALFVLILLRPAECGAKPPTPGVGVMSNSLRHPLLPPLPPAVLQDPPGHLHSLARRKFWRDQLSELPDGTNTTPTRLERMAIRPSTTKDYDRRYADVVKFLEEQKLKPNNKEQWDTALAQFLDTVYLRDRSLADGSKFVTAVCHHVPLLWRAVSLGSLPRVQRALKGWNRVAPPGTRQPLPLPVIESMVVMLLRRGLRSSALATMLAVDAYLRPSEVLGLEAGHIVPGQEAFRGIYKCPSILLRPESRGRPTKTNTFDESVLLDDKIWPFLSKLVVKRANMVKQGPIFAMSLSVFNKDIKLALADCGLVGWPDTAHSIRHTGPSHDLLVGTRSLLQAQKRGRWADERSVRNYEKSARIASRLQHLNKAHLEWIDKTAAMLRQAWEGRLDDATPYVFVRRGSSARAKTTRRSRSSPGKADSQQRWRKKG